MATIPRVVSATPAEDWQLVVCFDNGQERRYDCRSLLTRPEFFLLRTPAFFRAVRVDAGGYGVSWNDTIDLSEYELWTNGRPVPIAARAETCAPDSSAR